MVSGGGHSPVGAIVECPSWVDTVMMALRRIALVLALCASVPVAACGFSEEGALDGSGEGGLTGSGSSPGAGVGAGGAATGSGSSAGAGAAPMGVPVCNPPACALPSPTAGWELALFSTSRADACPAGFDSTDPIESPLAGADACACAACVTTGTTCSTGSIPTKGDNGGGACGSNTSTLDANGGACQNLGGNFSTDALVLAPPAVKGTCTAAASPVPGKVMTQPRRLCTQQASTCAAAACGVPASMKACIAATGDVPCPSGTKHLVGSDVSLACAPCGCSISSATCGGGMDFYSNQNCTGSTLTLTAGACKATNASGFQSAKWKGLVASEVCATTPVAPTTSLQNMRTVCCP